MNKNEKKGIALLALSLVTITIVLVIIIILNILNIWVRKFITIARILTLIALMVAISALALNRNRKKTLSILSLLFSILTLAIVLGTQWFHKKSFHDLINEKNEQLETIEKNTEENFKWTKEDYDNLTVVESQSDVVASNYDDIVKQFGEPTSKHELSSGDVTYLEVIYDNMNSKYIELKFTKQEDGNWLLTSKKAFGFE
ncbi:hypothetical protein [Streptococcus pacificus]|uniref:DUF4190 domain-containing protein n=1 Tax=Streptococcus pacificus TaxID=2740577 RepID=A0ABS0ZKN1_9STRE|nr:hypothetical protein [Streptococcus pacificus]MBJ8326458.1 hypothetical protein [Streptococcus pacificus]